MSTSLNFYTIRLSPSLVKGHIRFVVYIRFFPKFPNEMIQRTITVLIRFIAYLSGAEGNGKIDLAGG